MAYEYEGNMINEFESGYINMMERGQIMVTHELKILPEYFNSHLNGMKKFEVRKNDRGFQCFDTLILREWDGSQYTGRKLKKRITYILGDDFEGVAPGFVVLGTGDFFGK